MEDQMKKIGLVILLSFVMGSLALNAQTEKVEKTQKDNLEAYYDRFAENLELNDSQKAKIKEINNKFLADRKEKRETTRGRNEQERLDWAKKQIARDDAIRKVLTEEQYVKYYANKQFKGQRMNATDRNKRPFYRKDGRNSKQRQVPPRRLQMTP